MLTAFNSSDNHRPTYLTSDALGVFFSMYTALGLPDVQAGRSLQVATRRRVLVGSRPEESDRLIDLMISAEAPVHQAIESAQDMAKKIKRVMRRAALLILEEYARP